MNLKPWTSGPRELLEHAVGHLSQGTAFDSRIAMISIDNAVELAIKTYLQLPRRVRGTDGPGRKKFEEKSRSFPDLLDLLEEFATDKLDGVSLGDLEGYHRLRNALYHDGNGVTVDPVHVDSYLQIARVLLRNLLDIAINEAGVPPPHSLLGQLVLKWGEFEQLLRALAKAHLPKSKHEMGSLLSIVDGLVSKGVLTGAFRSRLNRVSKARNEMVHGVAVPTEVEIRPIITELDNLLDIVKKL
jgi:uncharacterized protein YutE (UPF0331/DUF86 family)